jgi:hypothetical protein
MRTLRLARVAAEAEGLRLRSMAQRTVTRVILGLVALIFLCGTLAFAHIAIWYWLRLTYSWPQIWTALALGGGDLVITIVLAALAARSAPGRVEREALEVRQRAWQNAASSVAFSSMAVPLLRLLVKGLRRRA